MRNARLLPLLLSAALVLTLAPAALASPRATAPGGSGAAAPAAGAIPGRYIVTLVDGADPAAVAREYRARGAGVDHVYGRALRGFAGAIPAPLVERLRADARVRRVEADGVVSEAAVQTGPTWGLDRIDQRDLPLSKSYEKGNLGAGVTVYVLDTGIRATHSEFAGRMGAGFTAINDGVGTDDCRGHGTHVAGTIGGTVYGVAKAVTLVPVRVLNCEGSGSWSGVIAGIDWVTANAPQAAVANMSLSGGANSTVDEAVRKSVAAGVAYTFAAGNNTGADACTRSPARVAEGLTVGATTSSDARADYSNIGTCLDLFAPGSSVTSAGISGDTSTATMSGTSMAAPHVAGVAALYLSADPAASVSAVNQAVVGNASAGRVVGEGTGSPDLLLHSLFPVAEPDPVEDEPITTDPVVSDPEPGPAPVAAVTKSCSGTTCRLDGSGSTGDGLTYRWSTGHETAALDATFSSPGSYTFTLTVTDLVGASDDETATVSCAWSGKGKRKSLVCS